MFRTRDFVLVFTSVAFLLMAIGVTLFSQSNNRPTASELVFVQQSDAELVAVVGDDSTFSRSESLRSMREKIAQSKELSISSPEPEPLFIESATTTEDGVVAVAGELMLCSNYQLRTAPWSPAGIEIDEVEGARLVFRTVEIDIVPTATATSPVPESYKDVLLQLPVRSFPAVDSSCIASDVIGVANDGSLIRNSEVGLYGIFDSNTVVGYALDGFPIYGQGSAVTDACGGIMGISGYQYQISADRETIINCFSAAPVQF